MPGQCRDLSSTPSSLPGGEQCREHRSMAFRSALPVQEIYQIKPMSLKSYILPNVSSFIERTLAGQARTCMRFRQPLACLISLNSYIHIAGSTSTGRAGLWAGGARTRTDLNIYESNMTAVGDCRSSSRRLVDQHSSIVDCRVEVEYGPSSFSNDMTPQQRQKIPPLQLDMFSQQNSQVTSR